MKILATHLKKFADYEVLRGIPLNALLKSIKRSSLNLDDPSEEIDIDVYYDAIQFTVAALGDDLLGVRVGNQLNLNTLGVIYDISLKATTNEEVIFYCQSYLRKTFPSLKITSAISGRSVTTELKLESGRRQVDRIILETLLTIMAREIKVIAGERTNVLLFSPFWHSGYPKEWKKGKTFSIKYNQTVLKALSRSQNSWGLEVLIPNYLMLIERMKTTRSFAGKAKIAALNLAKPTLPDLKTLASIFNMNERAFQRALNSEGTTYRNVIDELKKEISSLLLRHARFSIADVSFILGYSETASFIHSFQKWFGKSPSTLRRELLRNSIT